MSEVVTAADLPDGALLQRYRVEGGHVDCYVAEVPHAVSLQQFLAAFYTCRAFRPERWLLGALLGMKADNLAAAQLAAGESTRFSAWSVEERRADEILLCDFQAKTRSWLMAYRTSGGTRLHFGSAVVPSRKRSDKAVFTALLGFHRWYSRVLLGSAVKQIMTAA